MEDAPSTPDAIALAAVRCLGCGAVYAKPTVGGTNEMNPGCPVCGYVGWAAIKPEREPLRRSAAGPPPRRAARSR